MSKILLLFISLTFSIMARADFLFTGALESRLEQGMDQNTQPQLYYDFSGDYKFQAYSFGIEYFHSQPESTGQQSLNLTRNRQGFWATASWETGPWGFVSPYVRGGLGEFADTVTTTLLSVSSTEISRTYLCGFGGLGLRWNYLTTIFVALEARLIFGENQNPQPSPSGLLRLGFSF
jgi:hypothetical protein